MHCSCIVFYTVNKITYHDMSEFNVVEIIKSKIFLRVKYVFGPYI